MNSVNLARTGVRRVAPRCATLRRFSSVLLFPYDKGYSRSPEKHGARIKNGLRRGCSSVVEHLSHGAEVASSIPANSIIFCALRCHNMATTVGMAAVRDGGNCTPIVPYPMIKT